MSGDDKQLIGLRHGGGEDMRRLIAEEIQTRFDNEHIRALGDSARLELPGGQRILSHPGGELLPGIC
ncbi:MAG: hypothetical protein FVQ81_16975 [Candidatus Glassbacteria bacterium]|nr:hypothetical protein [Candidatus Glassbacteria bacterium]